MQRRGRASWRSLAADVDESLWCTKAVGRSDRSRDQRHSQRNLACAEIRPLYDKYLKANELPATPHFNPWANAGRIPAATFWSARRMLRQRMIDFIRQRLVDQITRQNSPFDQLAWAHGASTRTH